MPWNGSGTFSRDNGVNSGATTWADDDAAGIKITTGNHDTHDQDLADGINACLAKNGENAATANLDIGGFKLTNMGNGTASSDALAYGQAPKLTTSNTFTNTNTFSGATTFSAAVTMSNTLQCDGVVTNTANNVSTGTHDFQSTLTNSSTDAGATAGPSQKNHRNSASPAASDEIGTFDFDGEDSADNQETYARIGGTIIDPTSTSEDGEFYISTAVAGTLAKAVQVGAGIYTSGATGGDQGADTINASAYYVDGTQIASAGLVYINTYSPSAASTVDITDDFTSYKRIRFYVNLTTSASTVVALRVSTDGGSTYDASTDYSNTYDGYDSFGNSVQANSTGNTSIPLSGTVNNSSLRGIHGHVDMFNHNTAANHTMFLFNTTYYDGTYYEFIQGCGARNAAQDTDAVRIFPFSGNVTGEVVVMGIKEA